MSPSPVRGGMERAAPDGARAQINLMGYRHAAPPGLLNPPSTDYWLPSTVLKISAGEGDEGRPVRAGPVAARVLAVGHVATYQGGLDGRELRRPQPPLPQQLVDGRGRGGRQEHALRVDPAVALLRRARADEDR